MPRWSAVGRLNRSGRFEHHRTAAGRWDRFTLYGYDHASIYVEPSDRRFYIFAGAIENRRFPNTDRLHDYLCRRGKLVGGVYGPHRYVLTVHHLHRVLEIIGVTT